MRPQQAVERAKQRVSALWSVSWRLEFSALSLDPAWGMAGDSRYMTPARIVG